MFENARDKAVAVNKSIVEANARADALLDPAAAKAVASRYTAVYVTLSAIFFFSAGFATGQYF